MNSSAVLRRSTGTASAPGRRERNKLEKRTRIVAAARELFQRQGFADTTTQEIAAAADVGTGTLFLYARSKEDLLIMVFKDEMVATVSEIFASLPAEASTVDQMMTVFGRMVDYHARDIGVARVLLKELVFSTSPDRRTDISELMDAIYGGLAATVGDTLFGESIDADLVARSAFALYYYALISWLGGAFDLDGCLDMLRGQLSLLLKATV